MKGSTQSLVTLRASAFSAFTFSAAALALTATDAGAQSAGNVLGWYTPPTQVTQTPVPPPPLVCQSATVTVFPVCPDHHSCGPGDGGPGMSQVTGSPTRSSGVTGTAAASGNPVLFNRTVQFSYTVPDVRFFAPLAYVRQLTPLSTRTWIVKASEVPGPLGSSHATAHSAGRVGVSIGGSTDTAGHTSTTGRWLLVGHVSAQAVVSKYFKDVSYGFSCELPVHNLSH